MSDAKTYRPGEEVYCKGKECKEKKCELCPAKKTTQLDVTDSYRNNRKVFPNGYYSSGGIARIKKTDKDGNVYYEYAYARPHGD